MITALKIRAMFADFDREDFDNSKLCENIELVYKAEKVLKEYENYSTKQEKEKYLSAKIVCDEVEKLKAENTAKWNRITEQCRMLKA